MTESRGSMPPRTLLGRIASGSAAILAALIGAWVVSVGIEWIGLLWIWPGEGAQRSAAILRQDLAWLTGTHPGASVGTEIGAWRAAWASTLASGLYHGTMVWTGLEAGLVRLSGLTAGGDTFLQSTVNVTRIYLVRLAIIVAALPLFGLMAVWGALEGLVRRDLRRYGADIEHAMIYHWARHLAAALVTLPVFVYLAWPDSLNPAWIFVPFALGLAFMVLVITAHFVKYV